MRPAQGFDPAEPAAQLHFRRGGSPGRGLRRKIRLRFHHLVIFTLLQAVLFTGLQRLCLFLLDWDHFRLNRIEVWPDRTPVGDRVDNAASRFLSSNLLALDTSRLASEINSLSWIKDARIRKVFPSTLRIEITVRTPMAVLDRGPLFLVDGEGALLAPAAAAETARWPRLTDSGRFQENYRAKIALARDCLDSLPARLRDKIETLDLSRTSCLILSMRNDPARLILDPESFSAQLDLYDKQAARWAAAFGRPATVDLRVADRAYVRLAAGAARPRSAAGREEVM
jgi:cell division septal protein FtsQ